jgi:hypothetical protein
MADETGVDSIIPPQNETDIKETKQFRVDLDAVLQRIKGNVSGGSRERSLAITKLQEAIMWLGMDLKAKNEPTPYPNSYKPENALVDPTAQGLKL